MTVFSPSHILESKCLNDIFQSLHSSSFNTLIMVRKGESGEQAAFPCPFVIIHVTRRPVVVLK